MSKSITTEEERYSVCCESTHYPSGKTIRSAFVVTNAENAHDIVERWNATERELRHLNGNYLSYRILDIRRA